jgi:microcystin-dependent protein
MSLESASYIHQLDPANPAASDRLQQGDDHIRMVKAALKATFPNITGPVNATQAALNGLAAGQVPFGVITLFYGTVAPSGWAICNGQMVPKTDGSGTVITPDMRGRVPIGAWPGQYEYQTPYGSLPRTITTSAAGSHSHLGSTDTQGGHSHGGATGSTSLTEAQLPAHRHLLVKNGISNGILSANNTMSQERTDGGDTQYRLNSSESEPDVSRSGPSGSGQGHAHSIGNAGDHAHTVVLPAAGAHSHTASFDVMQPSMALHFIMKI